MVLVLFRLNYNFLRLIFWETIFCRRICFLVLFCFCQRKIIKCSRSNPMNEEFSKVSHMDDFWSESKTNKNCDRIRKRKMQSASHLSPKRGEFRKFCLCVEGEVPFHYQENATNKNRKLYVLCVNLDSMCIFTLIPLDLATNENTVILKQLVMYKLIWQKPKTKV